MTTQLLTMFSGANVWLLLAVLWSIPWKGVALWKSARLGQKWWFVVFLIVNTFAILEIIYIFFIARKFKVVEIEDSSTKN